MNILKKIFKSRNEKYLNQISKNLPEINKEFQQLKTLSLEEFKEKAFLFKQDVLNQINNINEKKEDKKIIKEQKILEDNLPKSFAFLKEAIRKIHNVELYDVQLLGGMILHFGNIAEMKTGEGKTYTAMLPAYLNSLTGKQIHVVTMNEYLAKRDAEKAKKILELLGVSVGCNIVQNNENNLMEIKKENYECNIIYGTANEFGFDYLRDNSALFSNEKLIKDRYFAIIDEVDSVLIDEARTPLILSNEEEVGEEDLELYLKAKDIVSFLKIQLKEEKEFENLEEKDKGDVILDFKHRSLNFTEEGIEKLIQLSKDYDFIETGDLFSSENLSRFSYIEKAAEALFLFKKDKDYLVKNNEVKIIDSNTGRMLEGQKWSKGLHQAIEVKENLKPSSMTVTNATTTLQHYFNKYQKLSGMSGTVMTDGLEFFETYGLECFSVPTNKPNIRKDNKDLVFLTSKARDKYFISLVKENMKKGRPILIGTASVKDNEYYSKLLNKCNIHHEILNAKNHEKEAEIIANAGRLNSVTLATNMAGRGTDIILGGETRPIQDINIEIPFHSNEYIKQSDESFVFYEFNTNDVVKNNGGLLVMGLSKGENRRVDNQLRGRAGRQGDVGESVFLISLEDDILQPFGVEKVVSFLGSDKDSEQPLYGNLVVKAVNKMQNKIEALHFEQRKNTNKFSKVVNEQTDAFYGYRDFILNIFEDENSKEKYFLIKNYFIELFNNKFKTSLEEEIKFLEFNMEENFDNLENFLTEYSLNNLYEKKWLMENLYEIGFKNFEKELFKKAKEKFENNLYKFIEDNGTLELKKIILKTMEKYWKWHLERMDFLRQSINLQGYSGKDPMEIYKHEAFKNFQELMDFENKFIKLILNFYK